MQKKMLAVLLILIINIHAAALADKGLSSAFPPDSATAACVPQIADGLSLPLLPVQDGDAGSAANLMLADPECVLLGSQDVLIAGLQGYTNEDLRVKMKPACSLAVSPLFLTMDRNVADGYGITDFASLRTYVSSHEYDLTFARHVGADPVDLAVTRLADEMEVLTDYFLVEEVPDVLRNGEAAAGVFSGEDLAASGEDWLILCCLGTERSSLYADVPCAPEIGLTPCTGKLLCLFMSSEASDESVSAVCKAAEFLVDSLPAGYEPCYVAGSVFTQTILDLFADYKEYMTSEGLFFYEE